MLAVTLVRKNDRLRPLTALPWSGNDAALNLKFIYVIRGFSWFLTEIALQAPD